MSKNVNKPVALAVSAALLGGMALSASAFAMTDLSAGYLLGATAGEKAAEGKCGEGKCGTAKMDTNKDGKISKDEFTAHMGTPGDYAKYDTNKNGYIDPSEIKAAHEGKCGEGRCGGDKKAGAEGKCGEGKCGGKGKHTVEGMDTNKDGKISKAEFAAAHGGDSSRFAKYDTNNDGAIDAAELKAAHEGKCGEGKCGEGKCGGDKKPTTDQKKAETEGKCGEGKCGGAA